MGAPIDVIIQLLAEIANDTSTVYRMVLASLILDTLSAITTGLILLLTVYNMWRYGKDTKR